jgi:outer membrane receptor protein involved in Fe transport
VHYTPDALGDLLYTGAAADLYRRNERWGLQSDASWHANDAHTLRFGLAYNDETATSRSATTVYPLDLSGAAIYTPEMIADDARDAAKLYGLYLQDEWKPVDKLTVNYGARFDWYQGILDEQQLSPRLGLVYELGPDTTLHAGYARYFTPPPTEKIRIETISLFENTTAAPNSPGNDPVRSERSHYFDAGVLERFTPALSVGLDGYYRSVENLLDEGQFGPALVFAPFNYRAGRIWGVELTGNWRQGGTSVYANAAYGVAKGKDIISGEYNFAPDELAAIATEFIHLDHDQRWTGSAGVSQRLGVTTLSLDALLGSGLRSGFINSGHLPSYVAVNFGVRHTFDLGSWGDLEGTLSVLNVLDRVYELRDGTGVGVGAPQWGARRALYAGLTKPFGH